MDYVIANKTSVFLILIFDDDEVVVKADYRLNSWVYLAT